MSPILLESLHHASFFFAGMHCLRAFCWEAKKWQKPRRLLVQGLKNEAGQYAPNDREHLAEALFYTCPSCPLSLYAKQSQSHDTVFPKDKTRDLAEKRIIQKKWKQKSLAAFLFMGPLQFLKKQEKQPRIQKKPKRHNLIQGSMEGEAGVLMLLSQTPNGANLHWLTALELRWKWGLLPIPEMACKILLFLVFNLTWGSGDGNKKWGWWSGKKI